MARAALFVFFVLSCTVANAFQTLYNAFNMSVNPCDDLYAHVCPNNSAILEFDKRTGRGLANDIVNIMMKEGPDDPVTKKIFEVSFYNSVLCTLLRWRRWNSNSTDNACLKAELLEEAISKIAGKSDRETQGCRLTGYGISLDDIVGLFQTNVDPILEYRWGKAYAAMLMHARFYRKNPAPIHLEYFKNDATYGKLCRLSKESPFLEEESQVEKFSDLKNHFVSGVITEFVRLAGIDFRLHNYVRHTNPRARDVIEKMIGITWWEKENFTLANLDEMRNDDTLRYRNIYVYPYAFGAYGNVLFARTYYRNKHLLNPDVAVQFEKLAKLVVVEVIKDIKAAGWLTDSNKRTLVDYLNSMEFHIGVPKKFRDVALLEKLLKHYQEVFEKVELNGICDLEMLSRAQGLARNRLVFNGNDTVNVMSNTVFDEWTLFRMNAQHHLNKVVIFPGLLHILNDYKLSTGFKYGTAGWALGHEIFHGLGLKNTSQEDEEQLKDIITKPHYKEQRQCYANFYGNPKFCSPLGCPQGERKAEEGFCDTESIRVVYDILKKALDASRKKRSPEDTDDLPLFNWRPPGVPEEETLLSDTLPGDDKQFFYGMQLFHCDPNPTDDDIRRRLRNVHPRGQIRATAVVQQMPAFSELFQCKAGQKNYRLPEGEMCAVYERHKNPVWDGRFMEFMSEVKMGGIEKIEKNANPKTGLWNLMALVPAAAILSM
uniref:Peptidase_M13 domain-containing protein n=1 Tax=Steinernema glaseri TaxID=37863 RepID=A0A1I8AN71_9BILA